MVRFEWCRSVLDWFWISYNYYVLVFVFKLFIIFRLIFGFRKSLFYCCYVLKFIFRLFLRFVLNYYICFKKTVDFCFVLCFNVNCLKMVELCFLKEIVFFRFGLNMLVLVRDDINIMYFIDYCFLREWKKEKKRERKKKKLIN